MDIKNATFMEGFKRLTADAFQKGWHERNGGNLSYRVRPDRGRQCTADLEKVNSLCSLESPVSSLQSLVSRLFLALPTQIAYNQNE